MSNLHFSRRARGLLLAIFGLLICVGAHAAAPSADDPDLQRVAQFRLDDQVVAKYIKAQQALMQAAKAHPESSRNTGDEDNDKSLADTIARVSKQPLMRSALASAGMSASDYVLCSMALLQSGLYAWGVQSQGQKMWAKIPPGIPSENTKWVIAHKAEMDKLKAVSEGG